MPKGRNVATTKMLLKRKEKYQKYQKYEKNRIW
jgi:hypothetical protein